MRNGDCPRIAPRFHAVISSGETIRTALLFVSRKAPARARPSDYSPETMGKRNSWPLCLRKPKPSRTFRKLPPHHSRSDIVIACHPSHPAVCRPVRSAKLGKMQTHPSQLTPARSTAVPARAAFASPARTRSCKSIKRRFPGIPGSSQTARPRRPFPARNQWARHVPRDPNKAIQSSARR